DVADFDVEDVCGTIQRVLLPDDVDINDAVDQLKGQDITASANTAAMMGGTAKGGATPKSTTDGVDAQVKAPEHQGTGPLVIVIDSGIDDAAKTRGDGWVTFVAPHRGVQDVDPLDVLDRRGRVRADGRLDLAAGHGTFVAGLISQIEPDAEIVMIRAIATDGVCTEDQVAEALCRAAAEFDIRQLDRGVVNLSLGLQSVDDEEPPILRAALDLLPDNVIVVAAAGNERTGVELWPAASERVCGVASLTDQGTASEWSNRGPWVNFSARGEGIISTFIEGRETAALENDPGSPFDKRPDTYGAPDPLAIWSGTSFATPQVSAQLATILRNNPGFTRADAIQHLHQKGTPLQNFGTRVPVF
ncbi:MAG TPA: S8/S53 family peptidase, partial [Euzebyales bacterium]